MGIVLSLLSSVPMTVPGAQGDGGNQRPGARDLSERMRRLPDRQNNLQENAPQLENRNWALRMPRMFPGMETGLC